MNKVPTDIFLDLPHVRSHLLDWGGPTAAPTILLIHGLNLTSNAHIWDLVAPDLAQSFRVLALDQRSHGLTQAPTDDDYGFAAMCSDMHLICRQLGVDSPIVVGHSWGGDMASQYAARYANSAAGVVMLDGGFVGINKVMTWPQAETMATPLRNCTQLADVQEFAGHWLGEFYNAEVFNLILGGFEVHADQTITPRLSFDNQLKIARAQWEQDSDALFAQVKCPALFLPCMRYEKHDPTPKQFFAWKQNRMNLMKTAMPHAQIEWLADSIHDVHLQHPKSVAEKIRTFAQGIGR
jgi:pimeloyl-ACP methyl ester carboxylesterase